MIVGGIVYGGFINKQDQKNKHFYTFDDLDEEAASMGDTTGKERMGALKALSIPVSYTHLDVYKRQE